MLQQEAQAYLRPTNPDPATMSPEDAQKDVAKNLVTYARSGTDSAAAKERIVNVMVAQMKISHDEATKQFDDAQARLKRASPNTVHFVIRIAALKSTRVVGCGARGRSG